MDPRKLNQGAGFRLWYDRFRMNARAYGLGQVFEFKNPVRISERDERLQVQTKTFLLNWTEDDLALHIYGVDCLT